MEQLADTTAPDTRSVLRYVGARIKRARWLLMIASFLAFGFAAVSFGTNRTPIWTGRTIIKIGLAPSQDFLVQESGPPLAPIETSRNLVSRISDPMFQTKVLDRALLEPATAEDSKRLVKASLRAIALEGDRNVAVEVSAATKADIDTVLQSLATEIDKVHEGIAQRRLEALRAILADLQSRSEFIEKSMTETLPRILVAPPAQAQDIYGSPVTPTRAPVAEFWSKLRDRVQRYKTLLELNEKTVTYAERGSYPKSERLTGPGAISLLTGLIMLVAMGGLAVVTAPKERNSAEEQDS